MRIFGVGVIFTTIFLSDASFAWTEAALSVTDPVVYSESKLSLDNVKLETKLAYEWVPGSLEWVRLDHLLTVPIAKVRLHLPRDSEVLYRGTHYFSREKTVELSVTLLEEPENKIQLLDEGVSIPIRFQNTKSLSPRVILDASCSPYPVSFANLDMSGAWAMIFCHAIHPKMQSGHSFRLDVKILWQGQAPDPLLTELSLDSRNASTRIEHGKNNFTLKSGLPEKFHPLAVSIGLGPYLQNDVVRPFFTLYGAYTFNEQIKLATFSAVPVGDSPHLDQGLYLVDEQAKGLDDRLVVNLLLGAHFVEFGARGTTYVRFSAPQGIELQYKDFLAKRRTFTFGIFYYPNINGTAYVNSWARYGWGSGFLELNYIRWQENIETGAYSAKSFGISYGLPLFRAL